MQIQTSHMRFILKLRKIIFPNYIFYNDVYRRLCRFYVKDAVKILHLGAGGDTIGLSGLECKFGLFVSLDIDYRQMKENSNNIKIAADVNNLPFKNGSFDLILSDAFFEHVKAPDRAIFNCFRISRGGSRLVFNTPNRFSYISMFNLYAPRFIKNIAKRMNASRRKYFPAYYRYNTPRQIYSISSRAGYQVAVFKSYTGWPSYFDFSPAFWLFFAAVHYIIEKFRFLSDKFSMTFICVLHKK